MTSEWSQAEDGPLRWSSSNLQTAGTLCTSENPVGGLTRQEV